MLTQRRYFKLQRQKTGVCPHIAYMLFVITLRILILGINHKIPRHRYHRAFVVYCFQNPILGNYSQDC